MKPEEIKFVFFGSDVVAKSALSAMARYGLTPISPEERAEVAVLVSYGKILKQETINSFKYGILNIHPSLLPKLRGPSPIKSAILENLEKTGVSIMKLDNEVDHGPVLAQEEIALSPRKATEEELRKALFEKGAELLARVLPAYLEGKLIPKEQEHGQATYTRKFKPEDAYLPYSEWGKRAPEFESRVRALSDEPGTYTILSIKSQSSKPREMRVKILKASIEGGRFMPDIVQPEGKRPMDWASFLRGNPLV